MKQNYTKHGLTADTLPLWSYDQSGYDIISREGVVFATRYPRIHTLQGSTFEVAGYSAVTPKTCLFFIL